MKKKKILVFCDFYLPGFKSGGGMWTVVNLVDRFSDKFDFHIVTRNYESKGDRRPYTTVQSSAWNTVGNAQVFYLGKKDYALKTFVRLFREVSPDAVFLNSALSMPVVRFLTARRKKLVPEVPVILAPCGEFSAGALSIKPLKKKLFLAYAKAFGLYRDVVWKASFDQERDEIAGLAGPNAEVFVAPDLSPRSILPGFSVDQKPHKPVGYVKFVFLSRLTRKKNLRFLLDCLSKIQEGNVELDVLGPVEDADYWNECLGVIDKLPPNIRVNAEATFVPYETGLERMLRSHFFTLPTLGENFGYVFVESMAAGTPLLVSDRTVWNELDRRDAGWEIPLKDEPMWISVIDRCIRMNDADFRTMSSNARNYAVDWLSDPEAEQANARVFDRAFDRAKIAETVAADV